MASTYTSNLRIDKQGTGDNNSTWGTVVNTDLDLIDSAIAGVTSVSTTGGTTTLTATNGAADQARSAVVKITGTLVSNATVNAPATATKNYWVYNGTTGAYTVTFGVTGGAGVQVPAGVWAFIHCDGTNSSLASVPHALWGGTAGGTANALTVTTGNALSALITGMVVAFKAGASANSGAATIAVDSVSATTIQKNGSALVAGDIPAGTIVSLAFDGTYFQIIGATSAQAGGLPVTEVTGTTQAMATDNAYVANNASRVVLTLPSSAAVGKRVEVIGKGAGGWRIAQNAGQTIKYGSSTTITGTAGGLVSPSQYSSVALVCIVADTTWEVQNNQGSITQHGEFGYSMSGSAPSTTNAIQSFDFAAETSAAISATMTVTVGQMEASNSSTKAYVFGGQNSSGFSTTTIGTLTFSGETTATLGSSLSSARWGTAGVGSSAKGYTCGGRTDGSPTNVIQSVTYSGEAVATPSATLATVNGGATGTSSSIKGYVMGGNTNGGTTHLSTIDALTFSGETRASLSATLDVGKRDLKGVNSATKGYAIGGYVTGDSSSSSIEDINFSTESSVTIAATSSSTLVFTVGINNNTKGYYMGGSLNSSYTTSIQSMAFDTETMSTISGTLPAAKGGSAGAQMGGYL